MRSSKKIIRDFLKEHQLTVISTVSKKSTPQSAVVEFAETENLELIFDCFNTSRKYRNIQQNPSVSFVIGWDNNITVQYEGEASELTEESLKTYKKIFYQKLPDAMKFEKYPEIRFFKVMPTWIRYSDLNKKPWEVFEINF